MFFKVGVLKKFVKFMEKHLCHSLFFNKVTGLRPVTLLKKDPDTDDFLLILQHF